MIIITWIIAGAVEKVEAIYIPTITLVFSVKSETHNATIRFLLE